MKLNQELIKRLSDGEIQLHNTGTVEQLNEILNAAFPDDEPSSGSSKFYIKYDDGYYSGCFGPRALPIFTTEQFFEAETETTPERSERIPDTVQPMDTETRELAKQLFLKLSDDQPMPNAKKQLIIASCKKFVQLLNNK